MGVQGNSLAGTTGGRERSEFKAGDWGGEVTLREEEEEVPLEAEDEGEVEEEAGEAMEEEEGASCKGGVSSCPRGSTRTNCLSGASFSCKGGKAEERKRIRQNSLRENAKVLHKALQR